MFTRPTGTVTFLFTDIEGSTALWERYPEAMRSAFRRHEKLIRDAVAIHNGYAYKMIGDAFQIAFASAPDALAAAVAIQRALQSEAWEGLDGVRVRMAIHTGVTEERSDDYVGPALNRAARLISAGHGGQILMSAPAAELLRDQLPPDVSLRDLGALPLKDLIRPEQIFQVVALGLPVDFPPLRTLDRHPHNLPVQLTSFIGREREMAEIHRLLAETHLLTLTGIGGTGKSRLALQAAAESIDGFPDGVWLVELASIGDPALVPQAIATALAVSERPDQNIQQTLADFFRPRQSLLILDNCEHLVDACAKAADVLLHACPDLKILASSREGLGIDGETTFHVPSLSLPDPKSLLPLESLVEFEAVRLFRDRARAVSASFALTPANSAAVAQICYRLDGIPLALELAAARVKALKVEEIAARLDDRFRLLTGGSRTALPRHQTLLALMDWSWDLLAESERVILRRLAVFAGGWSLGAAESVCADANKIPPSAMLDLLTHLVDKSLIRVDELGEATRYQMLETVRQYALAKLIESGETEEIRAKHLHYFMSFAERAEPEIAGVAQVLWLDRVELEHDNLRAALDWSQQTEQGAAPALRLAGALAIFWTTRGYLREGRERIGKVLEHAQALEEDSWRGKVLIGGAYLAYRQSDYTTTRLWAEQALAIFRRRGDSIGIADALSMLGNVATEEGDYATSPRMFEEGLALYREHQNTRGAARALTNLGWAALRPGNVELAKGRLEEALGLYRQVGDKNGIAMALAGLAEVAVREDKLGQASQLIEASLAMRKEIGYKWGIGVSLGTWAWIAMRQRDWNEAFSRLRESIAVRSDIGDKGGIAWCLERLAEIALETNENDRSVRIFAAASALRSSMGSVIDPADQPAYEHNLSSLRQRTGEEDFSDSWGAGSKMTLEQALDYATKKASTLDI